jgi:hypothetical protein
VALDSQGNPCPVPALELITEEEQRLFEAGRQRYLNYKQRGIGQNRRNFRDDHPEKIGRSLFNGFGDIFCRRLQPKSSRGQRRRIGGRGASSVANQGSDPDRCEDAT